MRRAIFRPSIPGSQYLYSTQLHTYVKPNSNFDQMHVHNINMPVVTGIYVRYRVRSSLKPLLSKLHFTEPENSIKYLHKNG